MVRYCAIRMVCVTVFFFQAEDGIRDLTVTGVQTCALPISFVKGRLKPVALPTDWPSMNISADVWDTWSTTGTRTFLGVKLFDLPTNVFWKPLLVLTPIDAAWTSLGSVALSGRATVNDRSSGYWSFS